jgi:ParB-like chromosome segregation protein Spo0J
MVAGGTVTLSLVSGVNENNTADGEIDLVTVEQFPEISILLEMLVPGIQLRAGGTDPVHVRLLADAAGAVRLPSILVQKNGCRVIDGKHRVEAAKLLGQSVISARVIDCTDAEALVLAMKSNTLHGLPLSRVDRICGAKRVLASHPDWSDRSVASVAGLSAKSIASIRKSMADEGRPAPEKRLGRDGKRHPITPAEGRRRTVEYIVAHPDASLRQIAREADVSLGTAQVIKEKLRCGNESVFAVSKDQGGPRRSGSAHLAEGPAPAAQSSPVPTARGGEVLAWQAISAKLANDPSLRYTQSGRSFLQWMGRHCLYEGEWREFVDAIPLHWLPEVAKVAVSMSEEWRQLAERLGAPPSPSSPER